MARDRIDIIDILLGRGSTRAGPRGMFDELAERLAGGGHRFEVISGEDLLRSLFAPPSLDERYESIDEAIALLIKNGAIQRLTPATKRSRVQLTANVVYIGPEGFSDDHPHINILARHPKPEKRDRWRLWSFCPRHERARAFHIKGIEDIAEAERVANIVLDVGLGLIDTEAMMKASLKPKPPAAAAPMEPAPVAPKPEAE
jgi:hypothetical protein